MSIDLKKLDRDIGRARAKVDTNVLGGIRKVAIAVDQALVLATPRDKGIASNNWLTSLNLPITEPNYELSGSDGEAINRALPTIFSAKIGDAIWISNNLPYISELNNGTSTQAPRGFVSQAVIAASTALTVGRLV